MTAVFLTRIDTTTNQYEGEVYYCDKNGIINCNVWNSPKLSEHKVIIAVGTRAIKKVFKENKHIHFTES